MKYLKAKSLLLAAAMLLASIPAPMWEARAASGAPTAKLEYVSGRTGTNYVVTGDVVKIRETISEDYESMGLDVKYGPQGAEPIDLPQSTIDKLNLVVPDRFTQSGNLLTREITLNPDVTFNPQYNDTTTTINRNTDIKVGYYNFRGKYSIKGNKGELLEKAPSKGNPSPGKVSIFNTQTGVETDYAVTSQSKIKFQCDVGGGETLTGNPTISIVGTPTGIFADYKTQTVDGKVVSPEIGVKVIGKEAGKPKQLEISLYAANGKTMGLRMDVMTTYTHKKVIVGGTETYQDDVGNTLTEGIHYEPGAPLTSDNLIRPGTTFELIYNLPITEPLYLTVMTPQYAIRQIESQIGEKSSYIELADNVNVDNIKSDFYLQTTDNQYNANFKIDWVWLPDVPEGKNEADYTGMVKMTSSGADIGRPDMNKFTVEAKETENVSGRLVAVVKYLDPKSSGSNREIATTTGVIGEDNETALPAIRITIPNKGKDGYVTQLDEYKGTLGAPERTNYVTTSKPEGELLPSKSSKAKGMDAFTGGISELHSSQLPKYPYEYNLKINMGSYGAAAEYAIVDVLPRESSKPEDVEGIRLETQLPNKESQDYTPGTQITNPLYVPKGINETAGTVNLKIVAQECPDDQKRTRKVTLRVTYYVPDEKGVAEPKKETVSIDLDVLDSTPSKNSKLESLIITCYDGNKKWELTAEDGYTFSSTETDYTERNGKRIEIPYRAKQVTFKLKQEMTYGTDIHRMSVLRTTRQGVPEKECAGQTVDTGVASGIELKNDKESVKFDFTGMTENNGSDERVGVTSLFVFRSPAAFPGYSTNYNLEIVRKEASKEARLESIKIYEESDKDLERNLLTDFNPDKTEYPLTVPYSTDNLRVSAEPLEKEGQIQGIKITPPLENMGWGGDKVWVKDLKKAFKENDGVVDIVFEVTAEDGVTTKTYTVRLTQEPPSTDATLTGLTVTDKDDQVRTYTPAFKATQGEYVMEIPYDVGEIKLSFSPGYEKVSEVQIYQFSVDPGNLLKDLHGKKKGLEQLDPKDPITTKAGIPILPINDDKIRELGYHSIYIVVTPEDEEAPKRTYELRVKRDIPSTDALLKSLTMRDQDEQQIKTLAFHPDEIDYTIRVPFKTRKVDFTPTANEEHAKIELKEYGFLGLPTTYEITSGNTSKPLELKDPGEETKFDFVVTAQDGKTSKTYTVRVIRELPSDDARLKALKVDNAIDFAPLFISSKNKYTATVAEGAQGVIITATANHPGATIRIDGNVVESGKPSDLIELLEVKQKVKIEVIAEDGVTRKLYVIEFTNQNLIEKTNNADLRRLEVNDGLMTPKFKPAVTEYEVTTTEKTYSVDIVPKVDDPLAKIRVLNGTREIGDYNGNYALALVDGENPITVEVTSPDKTVVKEYNITIFRNVEEKLKTLEPLEAEDIDYENSDNPILVKIEEYPRVGASVFEELKNYPEKSIIFQGNDYSLRFDADNLNTVIPQAEIYDFRMSFTSPDEDDIYAIIGAYEANDDIIDNVVMAYFTYHGSLPGPAAFRLSLGTKYGSRTLYWHYYNQERDRIDYYGTVKSNNKGNFGVTIDHFSTYLISPKHRLAGSEDKRGVVDELGMVLEEDYELIETGGKVNPNTGEEGGRS